MNNIPSSGLPPMSTFDAFLDSDGKPIANPPSQALVNLPPQQTTQAQPSVYAGSRSQAGRARSVHPGIANAYASTSAAGSSSMQRADYEGRRSQAQNLAARHPAVANAYASTSAAGSSSMQIAGSTQQRAAADVESNDSALELASGGRSNFKQKAIYKSQVPGVRYDHAGSRWRVETTDRNGTYQKGSVALAFHGGDVNAAMRAAESLHSRIKEGTFTTTLVTPAPYQSQVPGVIYSKTRNSWRVAVKLPDNTYHRTSVNVANYSGDVMAARTAAEDLHGEISASYANASKKYIN